MKHFLMATAALALAGIAFPIQSRADPPPKGSEDDVALTPYSGWVTKQAVTAGGCCDMADGRVVNARIAGDHWQVWFVHPESLTQGSYPLPSGWQNVPEAALLHGNNPTGHYIAWWYRGAVRCFAPISGT